ncbi:MAG: 3-dehydroquinate dehydratase [Gemmatimonadaceae bacterium]|nr:3-dehydroquinate dehydratase [Gemmatimonadaceae bacterium]
MRIAVLHGPNLNLLGTREPEIYGSTTLAQIDERLGAVALELGVDVTCFQSNHEGALVDAIQGLAGIAVGAIINAGAFSHSSLAIRDALTATGLRYVEVHISNIFAREPERRHTVLASGAVGVVAGLGAIGYELALRGLVAHLTNRG